MAGENSRMKTSGPDYLARIWLLDVLYPMHIVCENTSFLASFCNSTSSVVSVNATVDFDLLTSMSVSGEASIFSM